VTCNVSLRWLFFGYVTHRVHSDDWMLAQHRVSPDEFAVASSVLCLLEPAMLGSQAGQELLNRLAQPLVGQCLVDPYSVSSSGRYRKEGEQSNSRRLMLVGNVTVIASRGQFGRPLLRTVEIIGPQIDVVEFEIVGDMSANGMTMQRAKILSEGFLLLWPNVLEILITENYHSSLSKKQRKLVLLCVGQLREL
jgi:hypothetical protein